MTLLESFLSVIANIFNGVVVVADWLLVPAMIVLLIVWLAQRSSVNAMVRMYGSDAEYDNARLQTIKRSRPVLVLGWILLVMGVLVFIGGLTWETYVESNHLAGYSAVLSISYYVTIYSLFAWFGGLSIIFARFLNIEVKSLRMLKERVVAKQTNK